MVWTKRPSPLTNRFASTLPGVFAFIASYKMLEKVYIYGASHLVLRCQTVIHTMSGVGGPRTYKAPPTFVTPGNPSFATYNANEDWDASAWFQALTTVRGPPGAKTSYDEPSPRGFYADTNADDFKSFVYGQAEFTEHHWPCTSSGHRTK